MQKTSLQRARLPNTRGFSLIEVCISVAIIAFTMVPLLGLLVSSLGQMSTNIDSNQVINISQQVLLEAQQMTNFYGLTQGTSTDMTGNTTTGPVYSASVYEGDMSATPPAPPAPTYVRYFTEEGDNVLNNSTSTTPIMYTANVTVVTPTQLPSDGGTTTAATTTPPLLTLIVAIRKTPGGIDAATNPNLATIVNMISCDDLSTYTSAQ